MTMINNTEQHISSKAVDVVLDPSTTNFPSDVKDVQHMANLIQPHAIGEYEDMKATTTKMGILRIATEQEVLDGIVPDAIVTPETLQAKWVRPDASETVKGLVRYANSSEREEANSSAVIGINTMGIWDIIRVKAIASTTKVGTVKLSTVAIGTLGVDNTTATTPEVVKAMIDTFAVTTTPANATELQAGVVKISPSPVVNSALHVGVAVSPKGFIETRATQTRVGTVRMATQAEANARTLTDVVLSPATLPIASTSQFGIVATVDVPVAGVYNKALSSHGASNLVPKSGAIMTGALQSPKFIITQPQGSEGGAATRKDYVDSRDSNLQTQINNRVVRGSNVVFSTSNQTLIFNATAIGGHGNGTFTLTSPWWNYDSIIVEASTDNSDTFDTCVLTKQQLTNIQNLYNKPYWLVKTDSLYWIGRFDSNGRTFQTGGHKENCRIWRVWGVNNVYVTT